MSLEGTATDSLIALAASLVVGTEVAIADCVYPIDQIASAPANATAAQRRRDRWVLTRDNLRAEHDRDLRTPSQVAKKVREHDGFRWFSATDEARVLKHSDQGREVSSYEVHEPGISFSKPPAPVAETFYVIDGTIRCIQGAQTREFKRGDLGFVSYEQETEVSYSDGLRFLRLVWPVQPGGEHREMSSLSVFDDHGPPEDHNGRPAYTGVVHQSPDLRHLTLCSRLPEGARYTHDSAGVSESFYLVAGTIEVVSSDRGAVELGPGDFVSVPESGEFELEFSAGVNCVCWFWSDQPLPMLVSGRR